MKKQFTILKVGYSKGIYGCSNEYFTCIYTNKQGFNSFSFKGMYGVEERVAEVLKSKGLEEVYTPTDYGLIPSRKSWLGFKSEYETCDWLEALKF